MEQNLPFDLDALLIFGKVVESRSLSKAATLLGMPKSTVSRKLTKLEADLGIKLLRKNTHQLTVTDLGEKVYAHAVNILSDDQNELANRFATRDARLDGPLPARAPSAP